MSSTVVVSLAVARSVEGLDESFGEEERRPASLDEFQSRS